MNAIVQMLLLAVLATISITIVLVSSEQVFNAKDAYNQAQLNRARALMENAFFHVAYCGDYCSIDVELPINVTLSLENNSCLLFDEYGNVESCYFPFSTDTIEINDSSFRVSLIKTELEVMGIG